MWRQGRIAGGHTPGRSLSGWAPSQPEWEVWIRWFGSSRDAAARFSSLEQRPQEGGGLGTVNQKAGETPKSSHCLGLTWDPLRWTEKGLGTALCFRQAWAELASRLPVPIIGR